MSIVISIFVAYCDTYEKKIFKLYLCHYGLKTLSPSSLNYTMPTSQERIGHSGHFLKGPLKKNWSTEKSEQLRLSN